MNESIRRIDARGLPCPGPVVATKKAIEEGGFGMLEVLVDSATAVENVTRFAAYIGHDVEGTLEEGTETVIKIRGSGGTPERRPEAATAEAEGSDAHPAPGVSSGLTPGAPRGVATVFISKTTIGSGNDELGALLMRGFIKTLMDADTRPARIILMNGGVHLAVEGSEVLGDLKKLADMGIQILACGTCLDYFGLKERLGVGRVSNMFEIGGFLLQEPSLSL